MHLFFLTRGIKHCVDLWQAHMQSQYYWYDQKGFKYVQGALQPIQLWSYVFPKESLKDVIWNMGLTPPQPDIPFGTLLRKPLKARKIPELEFSKEDLKKIPNRLIYTSTVSRYPIGIKDDQVTDGTEHL